MEVHDKEGRGRRQTTGRELRRRRGDDTRRKRRKRRHDDNDNDLHSPRCKLHGRVYLMGHRPSHLFESLRSGAPATSTSASSLSSTFTTYVRQVLGITKDVTCKYLPLRIPQISYSNLIIMFQTAISALGFLHI